MCDFYRISMPELFKIRNAPDFPAEQAAFLENLRSECFRNAQSMASILADTAERGLRFLADSLIPSFAYNSNRVLLYYMAKFLRPDRPDAGSLVEETIGLVQQNNDILRLMSSMNPLAEPLVRDRIASLRSFGLELLTGYHDPVYHGRAMAPKSAYELHASGFNCTHRPTRSFRHPRD